MGLLKSPGPQPWETFTTPTSMREVEPNVSLILGGLDGVDAPKWEPASPPGRRSRGGRGMNQPYPVRVGELRPSQLLWAYGCGSLVDLPQVSVVVMGLNFWDPTTLHPDW